MAKQGSPRDAEVIEIDDVPGPGARCEGEPAGKPRGWENAVSEAMRTVALPLALTEPVRRANAFHNDALARTAAFLIVLSRNNGYEGRDPALIADELNCGLVAEMLGVGIDTLAGVLIDLERRGLVISSEDGGLRLADIDALDRLSEGQPASLSARRELFAAHA